MAHRGLVRGPWKGRKRTVGDRMGVSSKRTEADGVPQASVPSKPEEDAEAASSEPQRRDPFLCPEHGEVHPDERPWLPKLEKGDLAPHAYCPDCGQVQGKGPKRGLDRGGLVNKISRLAELLERDGYVCTQAQKRLIFKRIDEKDLDDAYGLTRGTQMLLVTEITSEILGVPESVIHAYLTDR